MWSRPKLDEKKQSSASSRADIAHNKSSSSPSPLSSGDEMEIEELIADFTKVSVQEISRAALTDTNSNFKDLCDQLNGLQVSIYRENTLKEADLIARRVKDDLSLITILHGEAKDATEANQRLMIAHVTQAYKRCLELDIEKWKIWLNLAKRSTSVKISINDFVPWERRLNSAPSYAEEKLKKPAGNTKADDIAFVQLALNYWRSCYHHIREYEKLTNAKPYDVEKQLWKLEQTALSYLFALDKNYNYKDLNRCRLREPKNINPKTGEPVSVAAIQEMIQQKQEESGYKPGF